jgi:ankyrin repeat protein
MSFTKKIAIESSMIRFRWVLLVWCIALGVGWAAAVSPPPEDLFNAAISGDATTVQALLARGADVNARANNGATALMLASQNGHNEVVQDLLAKGADVNA